VPKPMHNVASVPSKLCTASLLLPEECNYSSVEFTKKLISRMRFFARMRPALSLTPIPRFLHEVQFSFDSFRCSGLQAHRKVRHVPPLWAALSDHYHAPPWYHEEDMARSLSAEEEEVSHLG
jgi:hypothetical protein